MTSERRFVRFVRIRRAHLAWLAASSSACGPLEPAGTPGALKEGGFVYCEDASAPCSGDGAIPDHIAVGTSFKIQYSQSAVELSTPDTTKLEVGAVDEDGLTTFRALEAGAASVEARFESSGKLFDFVRLDLGDVDALAIRTCDHAFNAITISNRSFARSECGTDGDSAASIAVSQGASLAPTMCVFPLDTNGNALAGRLPFKWSAADAATAEIEMFVSDDQGCATVGGLTMGTATVTVAAEGVTGSVDVLVNP